MNPTKMHPRQVIFLLPVFFALCFPPALRAQRETAPERRRNIITDDVMMMTTAATGLETLACGPYPGSRTIVIKAGRHARIDWSAARRFGRDTLRILQLEIVKAGTPVAAMTLAFKPRTRPMQMYCMKGFGCQGTWEPYPWKSPDGNFLEQPAHRFRLTPVGNSFFTIQNMDDREPITVRINPCPAPSAPSGNKQAPE